MLFFSQNIGIAESAHFIVVLSQTSHAADPVSCAGLSDRGHEASASHRRLDPEESASRITRHPCGYVNRPYTTLFSLDRPLGRLAAPVSRRNRRHAASAARHLEVDFHAAFSSIWALQSTVQLVEPRVHTNVAISSRSTRRARSRSAYGGCAYRDRAKGTSPERASRAPRFFESVRLGAVLFRPLAMGT
jgi:hypothetical protein